MGREITFFITEVIFYLGALTTFGRSFGNRRRNKPNKKMIAWGYTGRVAPKSIKSTNIFNVYVQ